MSDKILASEIRCRFLECQRILQTKTEDNGAGYGWLWLVMLQYGGYAGYVGYALL